MNALVRKEIRQVFPAWIAAMVLALAPAWLIPLWIFDHGDDARSIAFAAFCLGTLLVSLSTFGQEFGTGTFQQLLAQPILRSRVWRVKMATLGSGLALALTAFFLSYGCRIAQLEERSSFGFLVLLTLAVTGALASGALWTTLLLRQIAAGFWLTIFMPFVFSFSILALLEKALNLEGPLPPWALCATLAVYASGGLIWAHYLFLRAQDVQWTGGNIAFPGWLRLGGRAKSAHDLPGIRPRPWRALIRKEIQLQDVGLLVGGTALLLGIVSLVLKSIDAEPVGFGRIYWVIVAGWAALWCSLPFLLGSLAVAEERKLGTLESALGLPASGVAQFSAKFGVAVVLALILGAILPWLIGSMGVLAGVHGGPFDRAFDFHDLEVLSVLMAGITGVCLYASTLTRTTLQAMGVAVAALAFLSYFITGSTNPEHAFGIPLWVGWRLAALLGIPILALCLLVLAYHNFRRLQIGRRDWIRNLVTWAAGIALGFTIISATYHRFWEYFTSLEPVHGQAQLFGPVRPQIGLSAQTFFVLLPDGRLWMTKQSKNKALYLATTVPRVERVQAFVSYSVPIDGEFVGGSNWVKLVSDWQRAYAIQSDGTLWQFSVPLGNEADTHPQPERMGVETNWSDLAAGADFFLLLKTDGTLWGRGNNYENQLGPGPGAFTNDLVRVGTNADWAAVFAGAVTSVAVKRDGSVWKWGNLYSGPNGPKGWISGAHDQPVRWDLNGADWVKVSGNDADLTLNRDGSIRASGIALNSLLGGKLDRDSSCLDFSSHNALLLAIKTDGTLVKRDLRQQPHRFGPSAIQQPSAYSDWLAVQASWSGSWVALASDGTLCSWREADPEDYENGRTLLGPSRRPFWSLNILANSK